MKAILAAVVAAFLLSGCAQLQAISGGISLATKSITNPVTKAEEAQIELALDSALAVLRGYKRACVVGTADKSCRVNIAAIQKYTRQMPTLIIQLRGFVDNNDQLNAVVVYNQLVSLYTNFKAAAGSLGYNVGNLP